MRYSCGNGSYRARFPKTYCLEIYKTEYRFVKNINFFHFSIFLKNACARTVSTMPSTHQENQITNSSSHVRDDRYRTTWFGTPWLWLWSQLSPQNIFHFYMGGTILVSKWWSVYFIISWPHYAALGPCNGFNTALGQRNGFYWPYYAALLCGPRAV